jgi:hypothetical protein
METEMSAKSTVEAVAEEVTEVVAEIAKAVVADVKAIAAEVTDAVAAGGIGNQESREDRDKIIESSEHKEGKSETKDTIPR